LRLLRDDGAIVYLNDVEIYRSNMPGGIVHESTPAVLAVGGGEENRFFQFGVWPYYLEQGSNTIAVEVHQAPGAIDDCSFDLTLLGNLPLDPPTAEILSPETGDVFASSEVYMSAVSSDTDGHIYQMDFYAGTNHIGTDTTEPYEMVWRNFPQGRYKLIAYAIDNTGRRGASAPVHIQVGVGFAPSLLRGPFLQSGTPTNIVVRWRTDWFESSRVVYGTNSALLDRTASQSHRPSNMPCAFPDSLRIRPTTIRFAMLPTLCSREARIFSFAPPRSPTALCAFGPSEIRARSVLRHERFSRA